MIKVNQPIEVCMKAYNAITNELSGIVAGQHIDGKYYVKLWIGKTHFRKHLAMLLKLHNTV